MAVVTLPFHSIWASGSIGKSLTCKDLHNLNFVMAHHIPRRRKLAGGTKIWAEEFTRKMARWQMFSKHLDKVEVFSSFEEF